MTEEEKKAIDCLKIVVDDINECGAEYYIDKDILSDIKTALNLIEKLQKENGELKENERYMKDIFGENICTLKDDKERFKRYGIQKEEEIKELKSNSIPKDKIRELLKESACEEKYDFHCAYEKLFEDIKELLKEEI